jgi:hypothetical protein
MSEIDVRTDPAGSRVQNHLHVAGDMTNGRTTGNTGVADRLFINTIGILSLSNF